MRRYNFVPPIVPASDYSRHLWLGAFSPTQSETFTEALTALRQLQILARVRKYSPENRTHPGLWDGRKDTKISNNSLSEAYSNISQETEKIADE